MNTDLRLLIRYLKAFIEKSLPESLSCLNIASLNQGVMNKSIAFILSFLFLNFSAQGQDIWNLERCIREALDKNLTIEQIKLNKQGYDISGKLYRRERIPSLNISSDFGFTVGRVINPATNNFETENSLYQSMGVGTGLTIYNGGRIGKSVRQNDYYLAAAEKDVQQAQEDISLNVANIYLTLLFAYENLEIAKNRVKLTEGQLENMEKMILAGTRPENDRYDILSQLAIDEQAFITAQNNIDINMLTLKQEMLMDPGYPLVIERPVLNMDALEALENEPFEAVYAYAINNQPQIQAAELRQQANEVGVDIARSQRIPSLTLGGNLGTNWSNLAKAPTGSYSQPIIQNVLIDGNPAVLGYNTEVYSGFESIKYGTQLDNNIGYGWGATLRIPILNNYSGQASIERAKINVINADIETEKTKQTLKTNIQNALTSAKAARKSLEGAEAAAFAARISLDNADKKAALGTMNNFEYLSARNRSDIAENNLLIARYDYYFQIKVIEYYMGRGISLD